MTNAHKYAHEGIRPEGPSIPCSLVPIPCSP